MDDIGVEELDEIEEERHRDEDNGFGSTNTLHRNITQLLERWKKILKKGEESLWAVLI